MKIQPLGGLARGQAEALLDELRITGPPVEPEAIASEKGIILEHWSDFPRDCYGALILDGARFRIAVSTDCPTEGHRWFTIAHELGHYHIEGHVEHLLSADQRVHLSFGSNFRRRRDPYEVEADAFASELLVPRRFAVSLVRSARPGLDLIREIVARFKTSLSCAAIRLAALTDEPAAVILSYEKAIEWVAASGPIYDHGWFRTRSWKGEWAPRGSGTYRLAVDSGRVRRSEEDGSRGLLCEWFEGAPDVEVVEEALGLGRYGRVLTVLACADLPDPDELAGTADPSVERDWRDALRGYELG